MTTLSTMLTSRDTAGTRYADALTELRAAYIDLAAYDHAIMNRNVGVPFPQTVMTFNGTQAQEGVPVGLRHPEYAPDANGGWDKAAEAQAATYLAALKAG